MYGRFGKSSSSVLIGTILPWVPESFRSRGFRFLSSLFLAASAYGRRRVSLRSTPKIPTAREKNLWYPGYDNIGLDTAIQRVKDSLSNACMDSLDAYIFL